LDIHRPWQHLKPLMKYNIRSLTISILSLCAGDGGHAATFFDKREIVAMPTL
jgi:hypothetical protein